MGEDRQALISRGQAVLARHRRRRSLDSASTSHTPASREVGHEAPGTAVDFLHRALAPRPPADVAEASERHSFIELVGCLNAVLERGEPSNAAATLAEAYQIFALIVPSAKNVLAQGERASQQLASAERAAQDARAEAERGERKLELFRKQMAAVGEAASRSNASSEEASRAHAEREELRRSLGDALDRLASEKEAAERRAAAAEAALASGLNGGRELVTPGSAAGRMQTLGRWSSFVGEETVQEAALAARCTTAASELSTPMVASACPATQGHEKRDVGRAAASGLGDAAMASGPDGSSEVAPMDRTGGKVAAAVGSEEPCCEENGWPEPALLTPCRPRGEHGAGTLPSPRVDAAPTAVQGGRPPTQVDEGLRGAQGGQEEGKELGRAGEEQVGEGQEEGHVEQDRAGQQEEEREEEEEVEQVVEGKEPEQELLKELERHEDARVTRVEECKQDADGSAQAEQAQVGQRGVQQSLEHVTMQPVESREPADGPASAERAVAAEGEELLRVQIAAIMRQHAEDSKRMLASDAGRLAMEALRTVQQEHERRRQRAQGASDEELEGRVVQV